MKAKRIALLCGLVSSICAALIGQAHLFGDAWEHIITTVGLIGSVASAYFMTHESQWDGVDRREQ